MKDIKLKPVPYIENKSCCVCLAQNYNSPFGNLGKYEEELYMLYINRVQLCLCKDCLAALKTEITI